jgi:hypothetical protein
MPLVLRARSRVIAPYAAQLAIPLTATVRAPGGILAPIIVRLIWLALEDAQKKSAALPKTAL